MGAAELGESAKNGRWRGRAARRGRFVVATSLQGVLKELDVQKKEVTVWCTLQSSAEGFA